MLSFEGLVCISTGTGLLLVSGNGAVAVITVFGMRAVSLWLVLVFHHCSLISGRVNVPAREGIKAILICL